jgi:hypothetical protein
VSTEEKFSNAFLTKKFCWAKSMPTGTRSPGFSNSLRRPSLRHGNICKIISQDAPITAWRSGSSSKVSIIGLFTRLGSIWMLLLEILSSLSVSRKLVNCLRRWPLTRVGMRSALRPAPTRFTSLKR